MNYQAIKEEYSFKQKVLLTILLLTIYKIGTFIPVPGIDSSSLQASLGSTDLGVLSGLMSGGSLLTFSIFALGVMPYITASIIIQLLSFNVVPALTELKKQGEYGKKKIKRITIITAMTLSFIQAISMTVMFSNIYDGFIINNEWYNYLLIIIILTLGSAVLIWFGEIIDKKGVGNGLSILIFGSILMSLPSSLAQYSVLNFTGTSELFIEIIKAVLLLGAVIGLIAFVTFVHLSERQIPIKNIIQSNLSRINTNQMMNNQSATNQQQSSFLPFKVIAVGVIPVIFASALMMIPTSIAQFNTDAKWSNIVMDYFALDTLTGGFLYAVLIVLFTFFYTFLQLNPDEISSNLQKGQTFIPGIKPGEETAKYLNNVLIALATIASVILVFISLLPLVVSAFISLPLTIQIGGISLLIIVNVALDLQKTYKVNKKKEKQRLSGFLKK